MIDYFPITLEMNRKSNQIAHMVYPKYADAFADRIIGNKEIILRLICEDNVILVYLDE